jgi:non-heme Fe2+,alpha-ketoglutarate-dependent halogenase
MSDKGTDFSLTSAQLEQFHRDGFIGPFDLYQEEEMERHLRLLRPRLLNTKRAVYGQDKTVSGVTNLANYDRHLEIEFLARHISRPEIVDRVASILGPDVLCWRSADAAAECHAGAGTVSPGADVSRG